MAITAKKKTNTTSVDVTPHDPKTKPVDLTPAQLEVMANIQTVCQDMRKASDTFNDKVTEAAILVGMLFAQSNGDAKYNRGLIQLVKATITNLVPGMSDGFINQIIETGRNDKFHSLVGIKKNTKSLPNIVKRYNSLRKREPEHGGVHASGWARNHPDILGRSTSKKASKKSSRKLKTTAGDRVTIKISKEAEAIVDASWDSLRDALTRNGAKLANDHLFRTGFGQLLDKFIVDDKATI